MKLRVSHLFTHPLRAKNILGAMVMAAAVFGTGCGNSESSLDNTSESNAATDTAPATAKASAQSSAAESKPLQIVTVYSARKEHLIKPLFEAYTAKTGVQVQYITDKAGPLTTRLQNEGASTQADILMTVDAGNLWQAAEVGVLRSIESPVLEANVPANLQDEQNRWFSLSQRARTIIYSTERVQPETLSTYEALGAPEWKGRLCLRTSKKVYNQSLVGTMIATQGEEKTEAIIKSWVANLAADPQSNDSSVMKDILSGRCDVGIVNTYYFGRLQKQEPDVKLALFWPNQEDRGVHVNVSGAGITQHAKNPEGAQALLEWLSSEEAQYTFADLNQEYPVNPSVKPSPQVAAWGEFKADAVNVNAAGRLQAAAVKLMDRAGYR